MSDCAPFGTKAALDVTDSFDVYPDEVVHRGIAAFPSQGDWMEENAASWASSNSFEAFTEEPVCRGIAMASSEVMSFEKFEDDFDGLTDKNTFSCFDDHVRGDRPAGDVKPGQCLTEFRGSRFEESCKAPALPFDPLFKLDNSTVFVDRAVSTATPIGNSILEFLTQKTTASVRKVSLAKMAVTADVFDNGSCCTVKVRVYERAEHGDYAIQFHRRCGCAFTFEAMYSGAQTFMHQRFNARVGTIRRGAFEDASMTLLTAQEEDLDDLPPPTPPLGATDITPLLELALMTSEPALQAEAAAALCCAEQSVLEQLCDDRGMDALEAMLRAASIEVTYPTARLLSQVAARPHAPNRLAQRGMMALMRHKLEDPSEPELLRRELRVAVGVAAAAVA